MEGVCQLVEEPQRGSRSGRRRRFVDRGFLLVARLHDRLQGRFALGDVRTGVQTRSRRSVHRREGRQHHERIGTDHRR